jgi:hypothetical protein
MSGKKKNVDKLDEMIRITEKVIVFFSLTAAVIVLGYFYGGCLGC